MKETTPLRASEYQELLEALRIAREAVETLGPPGSDSPTERVEALRRASEKARFAAQRLGGLWVAARFDAGEFQPDPEPVPVRALLEKAVEDVKSRARESRIEINTKIEAAPPILGDPRLLRSLMTNLLASTIQVSKRGTRLLVSAFKRQGRILIKIEDQGDGITGHLFPNLMEGARSGDDFSNDSPEILDVGTLTAKPIVDAHEGEMWVERQGESGGALFLALPRSEDQAIAKRPAEKTVLIVDDDPDNTFMLEQVLAKGGFTTETARDGLSGLTKAKSDDVGLVLLDVMLPGMDGFEVCHRLREDPKTAALPIVMVSAKAREEDRQTGLRMGANAYMTKPLRLSEVIEKVGQLLGRSD